LFDFILNLILKNLFLNIDKYLLPFKQAYLKADQVRELKLNKKNLPEEEYQEKLEAIKRYDINVISFDLYEKLGNVEFYTDHQTLQGDTFAELSFNSKDKACNFNYQNYKINLFYLILFTYKQKLFLFWLFLIFQKRFI